MTLPTTEWIQDLLDWFGWWIIFPIFLLIILGEIIFLLWLIIDVMRSK